MIGAHDERAGLRPNIAGGWHAAVGRVQDTSVNDAGAPPLIGVAGFQEVGEHTVGPARMRKQTGGDGSEALGVRALDAFHDVFLVST
jgi:hypothetical protein